MEAVGDVPSPSALTTPPRPWWEGLLEASAPTASLPAEGSVPGPGWPDLHTVEYLTKLIVLGLLLLALPWLLAKVVTAPGDAMKHAAHAAGMK
jgi:hypothetical protein